MKNWSLNRQNQRKIWLQPKITNSQKMVKIVFKNFRFLWGTFLLLDLSMFTVSCVDNTIYSNVKSKQTFLIRFLFIFDVFIGQLYEWSIATETPLDMNKPRVTDPLDCKNCVWFGDTLHVSELHLPSVMTYSSQKQKNNSIYLSEKCHIFIEN